MATYNLLPDVDGQFEVQFDLFTPRPHFIILPKNVEAVNREFCKMKEEQQRQFITVAKEVLSRFRIGDGTLSIHCGSWRSDLTGFHGHLCVDSKKYLEVFFRKKANIPKDSWPSVHSRGKWKYKNGTYAENVHAGYPYESPFNKEVAAIEELKTRSSLIAGNSSPQVFVEGVVKRIQYHSKLPIIGFLGHKTDSTQDLQEVLLVMEHFAGEHGLTNLESSDENKGCHLCLYLDSAVTEGQDLRGLGYIVTTGPRFYQLCSVSYRPKWFNDFKQTKFKCVT